MDGVSGACVAAVEMLVGVGGGFCGDFSYVGDGGRCDGGINGGCRGGW